MEILEHNHTEPMILDCRQCYAQTYYSKKNVDKDILRDQKCPICLSEKTVKYYPQCCVLSALVLNMVDDENGPGQEQ